MAYLGNEGLDPVGFNVGDTNTRRVEPRNTPTVINAVYNHRQFWDGRAENVFNGVNHLGTRDPDARVVRADDPHAPALVRIELVNASLASQALVPVLSDHEMSAPGRTMLDVAAQITQQAPARAARRSTATTASSARSPRKNHRGLAVDSYDEMIRAAFHSQWWDSTKLVRIAANGSVSFVSRKDHDRSTREVPVMHYNFSLFFGLAIQMYESTLVSDDSPWDRFRRQHPVGDRPGAQPVDQQDPDHISRGALWGAHAVQRPHARPLEHPLLELPRVGRADRRVGPPHHGGDQRPGAQPRRQHHRQGLQQHRHPSHHRRPRRRRLATPSARSRTPAACSPAPRRPRSTAAR